MTAVLEWSSVVNNGNSHTYMHMCTSSSWINLALTRALGKTQAVAWVLFCMPRNCRRVGWPGPRLKTLGEWQLGAMAVKQAIKARQVDRPP